jgi:hypothetical protein|tara:strand:+ start:734 stop:865 length:132 start_codon:yes stop_codon:yes gene_type:complete
MPDLKVLLPGISIYPAYPFKVEWILKFFLFTNEMAASTLILLR